MKSRGSSGARGIAPSAMPQSMSRRRGRAGGRRSRRGRRAPPGRRAAEVGLDVRRGGARAPGRRSSAARDGDEVAQHRLERAVGVERLERGAGAGGPVGGQPGVEVVLRGEVAVDRALGVFGALGDRLDGHRLPVVAVEERHRGVEQALLAPLELPGPRARPCSCSPSGQRLRHECPKRGRRGHVGAAGSGVVECRGIRPARSGRAAPRRPPRPAGPCGAPGRGRGRSGRRRNGW